MPPVDNIQSMSFLITRMMIAIITIIIKIKVAINFSALKSITKEISTLSLNELL